MTPNPMNPFRNSISGANAWVVPVSVMAMVLGVMLNLAWITQQNRKDRLASLSATQASRIRLGSIEEIDQFRNLSEEVARLREDKTKLEQAMGSRDAETAALNNSLQEIKVYAGLAPVEGQGIKIVLSDSTNSAGMASPDVTIHDADVLKVVNELWAAGAEAIAVNNHRVAIKSSFRCVGPVIHVDNVPIASPVTIHAIGDADALFGGLNLPGGVLDEIRQVDPAMVKIEKMKNMVLPAYTGLTGIKYAKPVEPEKDGTEGAGQ